VGHPCARPGCPVQLLGVLPGAIAPGSTPNPVDGSRGRRSRAAG
jgi:hypothetical protein